MSALAFPGHVVEGVDVERMAEGGAEGVIAENVLVLSGWRSQPCTRARSGKALYACDVVVWVFACVDGVGEDEVVEFARDCAL